MSLVAPTQLDHGESAVSTAPETESERDNLVRYRAGEGGHVESHFLKANSPDGTRALWIKHTLLIPAHRPADAVAEVWAIAFAERGARKLAAKRTFPIADARFSRRPFFIRVPCAEFGHGWARGAVGQAETALGWELRFACPERAFRPFRYDGMYTAGFPRSKTLTPAPDVRVEGHFRVWGERWELGGWRGAQGHNWGSCHAHAYAWVHANAWTREDEPPLPDRAGRRKAVREPRAHAAHERDRAGAPLEGVWLEALSARVRLGRVVTPWLSLAGIAVDGQLIRFDRARALCTGRARVDARSYHLELKQDGAQLEAQFAAETEQFAGLCYEDPDGLTLSCLNSKLARGRLTLRYGGRTFHLRTEQAALELGTRAPDHGVPLLV